MSSSSDVAGTGEGSERGGRRKDMAPAAVSLGHEVKSFMTVILLDGALSVLHIYMKTHVCFEESDRLIGSRFFFVNQHTETYPAAYNEFRRNHYVNF